MRKKFRKLSEKRQLRKRTFTLEINNLETVRNSFKTKRKDLNYLWNNLKRKGLLLNNKIRNWNYKLMACRGNREDY